MMSKIYARAGGVLVWLGDAIASTEEAVQVINIFDSTGMTQQEQANFLGRLTVNDILGDLRYGTRWKAVSTLLEAPWFKRVWVMQEIALSTRAILICGPNRIFWETLDLFCNWLSYSIASSAESANSNAVTLMAHLRRLVIQKRMQELSLFELLAMTRHLDATVPHDHIFGMLALGDFAKTDGIVVDYNQPCEILYTNLAITMVQSGNTFKNLSLAGLTQKSALTLPTWVPDWSLGSARTKEFPISEFAPWFWAGGPASISELAPLSEGRLEIDGFLFDTISKVTEKTFETDPDEVGSWESNNVNVYAQCAFIRDAHSFPNASHPYPTGKPWSTIWPKFLACSQWLDPSTGNNMKKEKVDDELFEKGYEGYMLRINNLDEVVRGVATDDVLRRVEETREHAIPYQGIISMVLKSRRCALTAKGWLGWVPREAREGDLVVVFRGAKAVHVLRYALIT